MILVHVQIVVRPVREHDTPVRNREFRIELAGPGERACGLVVVEGIKKDEPLVEESLGFRTPRRNGVLVIAQSGHQFGRAVGFACRMIGANGTGEEHEQEEAELTHGLHSPLCWQHRHY